MDDLIKFFDSKVWFLMLVTLLIVLAYFIMLIIGSENAKSLEAFFNIVVGFWFGIGSGTAISNYRASRVN